MLSSWDLNLLDLKFLSVLGQKIASFEKGFILLPAAAWKALNSANISGGKTNHFFPFVLNPVGDTSMYQIRCCSKSIYVGFVTLSNQVLIFESCLLSQEKNLQVYLTVTDGLVNKCGNNSAGVTVLAAGTPGHTTQQWWLSPCTVTHPCIYNHLPFILSELLREQLATEHFKCLCFVKTPLS